METPSTVRQAVRPLDYMVMIDLKNAYFQIPIHPLSRKYLLLFVADSVPIQGPMFWSLCSSKSLQSGVHTSVDTGSLPGNSSIALPRQLDNTGALGGASSSPPRQGCGILSRSRDHGELQEVPSGAFSMTGVSGMILDTVAGKAFMTPERLELFRGVTLHFLQQSQLPAHQWQQLLGHWPCWNTSFQTVGCSFNQFSVGPEELLVAKSGFSSRPSPSGGEHVCYDLEWWLEDMNLLRGSPLQSRSPNLLLFTYTSKEGWGVHLLQHLALGLWSDQECRYPTCWKLRAAFLALHHFSSLLTGHSLVLMTDNTTVMAYVNHQGSTVSL
ncbi:uncharacterized protein LOC135209831 [Macrobrachium nipponense]|uniref:uncharacterized protein LOC135209831 n=1 Tax=Macrobrachium nipponense TaxID=159736 RepID=UPI0030C7EBD2